MKTTKMEDDQNGRRPKWTTTKMEDDQNGRRPKWKTTKMEDDQNGRRPKWKTTKIEECEEKYQTQKAVTHIMTGNKKSDWEVMKIKEIEKNPAALWKDINMLLGKEKS